MTSGENDRAKVGFARHSLATLAYRAGKTLRGVSQDFGGFKLDPKTRTPLEILAHMNDLFDWALHLAEGRHTWHDSSPSSWDEEVERLFEGLERLDRRLADPAPTGFPIESIFQGPIADALCHTGQLAMLRRLAGEPIRGENYFKAEIETGRLGADQAKPTYEFD